MYDNISLSDILSGIEGVLKIEYVNECTVEDTIKAAVNRLEDTYQLNLRDKDLATVQSESQLMADYVSELLKEIHSCLEQMSFYISLKLYHKNHALTLSDINYLGYSKSQLLTALKYLEFEDEYKGKREDLIKPITRALNNINMCTNKRIFVIMLMLERLGLYEGVSIYARLLYMGGLIV